MKKAREKEKAIELRREGKTYGEILEIVSVTKSTLSLWFRDVGLSKRQEQTITKRRIEAQRRGHDACRRKRLALIREIHSNSREDIKSITKRDLWLMGIALYWAEGSKQRDNNVSEGVRFGNSDHRMIKVYLLWLKRCMGILDNDIRLRIAIHENHAYRIDEVRRFWSNATGFDIKYLSRVYYKKHNAKTNRSISRENYQGLLEIRVSRSTNLNRRIEGWINAIADRIIK